MTQVSSLPTTVAPDAAPARSRSLRLRRVLPAACLVAALAALGGGLAQALLSAGGSGTGSATTGSIGVTPISVVSHTCTYASLQPGDLTSSDHCTLQAQYTGNVPAWESLTVKVESSAGPGAGASTLYDGSGTSGLVLSISDDGGKAFTVPLGAGTTGGSCPAGKTCWSADHDLAAWYSGSTPNLNFTSGETVTWTVTPTFASSVNDNLYQGGSATVTLVVNSVQSQGNDLPTSCTTPTPKIGQPCPAAGTFTWSS